MQRDIEEVLIVGGGDVGLLTALSLREIDTDLDITVVDDLDSPPPRVGKSTFSAIMELLHDFLGIDETAFTHAVKPIWKGSVWFKNWGGCPDFHYPFAHGFPSFEEEDRHETLHAIYQDPRLTTTIGEGIVEQGKTPWYYNPRGGGFQRYPRVAYHLPIDGFQTFLADRCESKGIELVDDRVEGARTSGARVDAVEGTNRSYEADLYIDASGFGRAVRSEFSDFSFVEFDLPLDRAIRASFERPLSEVTPATVVEGHEQGWFWTIDTYDARDRGFVYSSEFTTDEEAAAIYADQPGIELDSANLDYYTFDSGYLPEPWVGNHLTIGNAAGFVEPLQSTALTSNIQFSKFLAFLLNSTGFRNEPSVRETYNRFFGSVWNDIHSFVSIHYKFNETDAPLWDRMRSLELPPLAAEFYEDYDTHGLPYYEQPQSGFKVDRDGRIYAGSPFNKEDFFHMFVSMGVESGYHEKLDREPAAAARKTREQRRDSILEQVEAYHGHVEFFNLLEHDNGL